MTPTRRVLHVLPHPGGGGDTYVDLLSGMDGFRLERVYLAPSPSPRPALARGVVAAMRAGSRHDIVHVSGEAAAGLCLPLLAARPSVVTLHGLHLLRRATGLGRYAAVINLRAVVHVAGRTICVSESERALLSSAIGPTARAVVVRNGVRIRPRGVRSVVRAELGLPEEERVAIWVGSLDGRKDPMTAARAAAEAGVTLLVVGDGPLRGRLEDEPRVRLLGRRADVPRLLEAADVFLLTSRREGLSVALLEALAAGLATVVSDLPENVEAVGDCGVAVAAGDVHAFAAGLVDAAVEPGRARERVATLFSAERMVGETRAVYDAVLGERQPRSRPRPTAQ